MENYTLRYNLEESNIDEDDLDGFDFQPADDDEFSDLLPEPITPTEVPANSSDQDIRDMFDERIENLFELLESIQNCIDDDESGEIWRELVRRTQASMDPDDGIDAIGLIHIIDRLEECYNHLVNDVIYHNLGGQR